MLLLLAILVLWFVAFVWACLHDGPIEVEAEQILDGHGVPSRNALLRGHPRYILPFDGLRGGPLQRARVAPAPSSTCRVRKREDN
jgi:hypothetical protein